MSSQTSTTYFRFPTLPCKPMLPILLYTVNAIVCEPKVASIILRLLLQTNSTTLPVEAPVLPATTQYSVSTSMQKTSVNALTEGRPATSRILYSSLQISTISFSSSSHMYIVTYPKSFKLIITMLLIKVPLLLLLLLFSLHPRHVCSNFCHTWDYQIIFGISLAYSKCWVLLNWTFKYTNVIINAL